MPPASPSALLRVLTWDGHLGTVVSVTADGWAAVRIDGETTTHLWQLSQLEEVA